MHLPPRNPCLVLALLLACPLSARAADTAAFDRHFVDATMRIDVYHAGDAKEESLTLDVVSKQGAWAGSRVHLLDPFEVGRCVVELRITGSKEVLFSKRFDSYFGEYRTTTPAAKGVKRTYHESVLVPFPKHLMSFAFKVRQADGSHRTLLETEIDPAAVTIRREPLVEGVTVFDLHHGGDPHATVDVAIVVEGYTASERPKLEADLARYTKIFLGHEPFASAKDAFNVRGVWKPSQQSGCDEPGRGVWKATAVGASFDALGSERYLLTEDNRALRDIAAHVPYDALYIMVNTSRYGGGGIYNLYCTFTADNQWSPEVFIHEFGHSFAGLADEYYTSSVAYNDFFPKGVEPFEPNVTALLDPAKLKWKDLVTPGTAVPTPWKKSDYDARDVAYQKVRETLNAEIAQAMRRGAAEGVVKGLKAKSELLSLEHAQRMSADLAQSPFKNQVGAFEGAGYAAKGLYRPALDCIMFSKGGKPFCPVCTRALRQVIERYGE
jgi:hypothetical protein